MKEITYLYNDEEIKLSIEIVRTWLLDAGSKVSNQEIMMFMQLCKAHKLNPFLKEAYLFKPSDFLPAAIITAKSVFLRRAETFPSYGGFEAGIVVKTKDGKYINRVGSLKHDDDVIVGGWCSVNVKGKSATQSVVDFNEYAKRKKDGNLNKTWTQIPATMIRKVAIVQALREAFSGEMRGMYIQEEMDQASNVENKSQKAVEKEDIKAMLLSKACENDTLKTQQINISEQEKEKVEVEAVNVEPTETNRGEEL